MESRVLKQQDNNTPADMNGALSAPGACAGRDRFVI